MSEDIAAEMERAMKLSEEFYTSASALASASTALANASSQIPINTRVIIKGSKNISEDIAADIERAKKLSEDHSSAWASASASASTALANASSSIPINTRVILKGVEKYIFKEWT